jgi:hypothetical protein
VQDKKNDRINEKRKKKRKNKWNPTKVTVSLTRQSVFWIWAVYCYGDLGCELVGHDTL